MKYTIFKWVKRSYVPISKWRILLNKCLFLCWVDFSTGEGDTLPFICRHHERMRCMLSSYQLTPGGSTGPQEPLLSWPSEKMHPRLMLGRLWDTSRTTLYFFLLLIFSLLFSFNLGPLWWRSSKRIHLKFRRCGFDPWVRKIPWRRAWQRTPEFLSGESPWTEESGGLHSIGLQESESLNLIHSIK